MKKYFSWPAQLAKGFRLSSAADCENTQHSKWNLALQIIDNESQKEERVQGQMEHKAILRRMNNESSFAGQEKNVLLLLDRIEFLKIFGAFKVV